MGRFAHFFVMRCYRLAIGVSASLGNAKAQGWLDMRIGNIERVRLATKSLLPNEKWVWFHCASVGEFEQAQPVMKAMRQQDNSLRFMLTFYSPSGWGSFAKWQPDWWRQRDVAAALPLDTPAAVRRFLNALTPEKALVPAVQLLALSKYEVWPELIRQVKPHARIALFAGHVIAGRWPFRTFGGFYRGAWRKLDKVLVQSDSSVVELGRWNVEAKIGGDPRFDRVLEAAEASRIQPDDECVRWLSNRTCLVVGSAWEAESKIAQSAWMPGHACIVVPHEWDQNWAKQQQRAWQERGAKAIIWSELRGKNASATLPDADVILLDAMGQLMHIYGVGQLALVGGGFGKGVHNTLEPAAHGLPIWVGPKVGRFAEVQGLSDADALTVASDERHCINLLREAWIDVDRLKKRGLAARNYATENAGAGAKIAKHLMGLLAR
jgi:3-deoxy-D-manno-octulosonic-acid transferase